MKNTDEAEKNAPLIQEATTAILSVFQRLGIENNEPVCLAVLGSLVGCFAAASGNPGMAMAGMNALAKGIIDGTLLD